MLIKDLPTARLRARAEELRIKYATSMMRSALFGWVSIPGAFAIGLTSEGSEFWDACSKGDWETARRLQPDLFKPMEGKPHFKIIPALGGYFVWDTDFSLCLGASELNWKRKINPGIYDTKAQAARAWHYPEER